MVEAPALLALISNFVMLVVRVLRMLLVCSA